MTTTRETAPKSEIHPTPREQQLAKLLDHFILLYQMFQKKLNTDANGREKVFQRVAKEYGLSLSDTMWLWEQASISNVRRGLPTENTKNQT
ncbi:MAG TPA: hypothetical protein VFG51_03515 [Candidatus Saccharimonadia bacterium]|nr:hypothetical protein [Candidatus Saccharimonadia bacterium]